MDHAGKVQEQIAEESPSAEAWELAGNLHFDWMQTRVNDGERIASATRAIRSYLAALELDPDNLDVRTDLGVAYLNDPANAMEAVLQTNLVLEADPDHVQANFNKGIMLVQIGRLDDAIGQFQKVQQLTERDSEVFRRAVEAEGRVQAMMEENGS
jgi:Flp pilus assembly protein TadD